MVTSNGAFSTSFSFKVAGDCPKKVPKIRDKLYLQQKGRSHNESVRNLFTFYFSAFLSIVSGTSLYYSNKLNEMDRKKEELSKQLEELQIHKELETKLEKQSEKVQEIRKIT